MLTLRSPSPPALALVLLARATVAQDPAPQASLDQIHPRTMISLGIAFGDEDVETNTGGLATGIVSRSTEATHIRLRAEHFFRSDFGFFVDGYLGIADDINDNLGSTNSSYDSKGIFAAVAYRATMGESFRLPVRFGPFFQLTEEADSTFTDGAIERSMFGIKLSVEPEVILSQSESNGRISELSAFAEIACGAGPAKVEDDVDSEDAYAFTLNWELGLRYRFPSGIFAGLSWAAQKYHVGTTESYDNAVFFGVDDDFSGIMITAGVRF